MLGRYRSAQCEVFYETAKSCLGCWKDASCSGCGVLIQERAATYARSIQGKGAAMDNCVGIIDGTGIFVVRSARGQLRSTYSGDKGTHLPEFKAIVTPDWLLSHIAGPVEGRRHVLTLYRASGSNSMPEAGLLILSVQYCAFGDQAYLLHPWMKVSFSARAGAGVEEQLEGLNTGMASDRVAVE